LLVVEIYYISISTRNFKCQRTAKYKNVYV
jgi:hypothetical protein